MVIVTIEKDIGNTTVIYKRFYTDLIRFMPVIFF